MKKLCAALASCIFLSGCVVGSLNPFYTPDLVVEQPQLEGSWYFTEDIEANDESPMVISGGKMVIYDDKGQPAESKITFFKIDDVLFADIFPHEGQLKVDLVKDGKPVHLISRVRIISADRFTFNALDYDWLALELETGRIQLPFEKVNSDAGYDIIFTATSEQWVEFLRKYKDDLQAFPRDGEAPLQRKISSQK